jgi:uncharacterized protein YodC (DUF2158 family)
VSEFKPGDVVALNSGGPVMTVRTVRRGSVTTTFFTHAGLLQAEFLPEQISLLEPPREKAMHLTLVRNNEDN